MAATDAWAQSRQVYLDAVIASGGAPISGSVNWSVWSMLDGRPITVVARDDGAPANLELEPGHYRVVAEYRSARRVQDIRVGQAPQQRQIINLNAGEVELKLIPRLGGKPIRSALDWRVNRYARGTDKGRQVVRLKLDRPRLLLAEGWYEVEVRHGDEAVRHAIEVAAGQRYDYTLVLRD